MTLPLNSRYLQAMNDVEPHIGGQALNFIVRPDSLHGQPPSSRAQQMPCQTDKINTLGEGTRHDRGKADRRMLLFDSSAVNGPIGQGQLSHGLLQKSGLLRIDVKQGSV